LIPKIIHACWKSVDILTSTHVFPKNTIQRFAELSPTWKLEISTDSAIDAYLRSNLDATDYNLVKDRHIVEKSDLWRLIKLYNEGGLYTDIDRLCNVSLDDIIEPAAMCLLPTCADYNFSQDFMASAPNNPIYSTTIDLILRRRKAGYESTYFLGPQTYMHGVTLSLVGEMIDVNPDSEVFDQMRIAMNGAGFIQTYREDPPYDTITHRPENGVCGFDHEEMKRDFYGSLGIGHWTGEW